MNTGGSPKASVGVLAVTSGHLGPRGIDHALNSALIERHVLGQEVPGKHVAQLLRTRGVVVTVQRLSGLGRAHPKPEIAGPLAPALVGRFAVRRSRAHPTAGHRG